MLTAEQLHARMEQIGRIIADLSHRPDDSSAAQAVTLVESLNALHAEGLRRILELIHAAGAVSGALLQKLAQDDLVRALLLLHGLHPINLQTRVIEAIDSLRPLVEGYGGQISIVEISEECLALRIDVARSAGSDPIPMLKDLIEQAICIAAPEINRIQYDENSRPFVSRWELPIVQV